MRASLTGLMAIAALLSVSACDAGHRDDPASDNFMAGPELAIAQPGPGWVGTTAVTAAQPDGGEKVLGFQLPAVVFELNRYASGDAVRYMLDEGPILAVEDPTRAVSLSNEPQVAGAYVLRAFVVDADGRPYGNRRAVAVRHFLLKQENRAKNYDVLVAGGTPPRRPFRDDAPCLIVEGPRGTVTAAPELRFALGNARLSEDGLRLRVQVDGGKAHNVTKAGPLPLGDLAPGQHELVVELQQRDGDEWQAVESYFNRYEGTFTVQ